MLAIVALLLAGVSISAHAQRYPERRIVRAGNREYAAGNWAAGEVEYRRALDRVPESYEAQFNLANALHKQERWDEAAAMFRRLAADPDHASTTAAAHYNAGNALFEQRKLEEALEEYKSALRIDPGDREAKFNLAYTKKLLEKDDEQQDEQEQNDQNDRDHNDEGNGGGGQDQNNQNSGGNGESDRQEPTQQQGGMSRDEAEQLLQAIQMNEDRTRDKVDGQRATGSAGAAGKNW